jgi:hypothetical protein
VNSGITPASASFADRVPAPALWDGACQAGERFPASTCDDKLIGARYFVDGFGRENVPEDAYLSPRDEAGHGTHVAAIAVGDAGIDPLVDGNPLGVDRITGVAPAAHLAVYKVCWVFGTAPRWMSSRRSTPPSVTAWTSSTSRWAARRSRRRRSTQWRPRR